jgi:hypothetical protein
VKQSRKGERLDFSLGIDAQAVPKRDGTSVRGFKVHFRCEFDPMELPALRHRYAAHITDDVVAFPEMAKRVRIGERRVQQGPKRFKRAFKGARGEECAGNGPPLSVDQRLEPPRTPAGSCVIQQDLRHFRDHSGTTQKGCLFG